ncbi:MAG: MopE-related protein [Chitinophagales bacterium]
MIKRFTSLPTYLNIRHSLFSTSQCARIIGLVTIILSAASMVFAQTVPVKEWDKSFGGTKHDEMYVIIQTNDGGYLLGGDSDSPISGEKSQGSQGFSDYWIVKTDALGNKMWDKRFGGNSREEMFCVLQTSDSGYLLGGWSMSDVSGDKTQTSRGESDYWIVKTDLNGNKLWDKRYGGTSGDELRAMAPTSDGGFILAGESLSGAGGEKTQANHGEFDVWVVKINAEGIKQWDASYGGILDDRLNAIQQTPDGGYIIGSWTLSPIGFDITQPSRGSTDMWLVKTDASGVKKWDGRYGGDNNEYLYALDQTTDGGFILGGYTRSDVNGDVTIPGKGGFDFWMVKTNSTGIKQWDKRYGGNNDEKGKSIFETTDGGFIMGGWSESGISGDKTQETKGTVDYWVVKSDVNGNKLWDLDFGASNEERLHDIPQTSDGGFIIGGHSYSTKNGDKSQTTFGIDDYWIVKLSASDPTELFYADTDNDGYGNAAIDTLAVAAPPGYVSDNTDCNDTNAAVNPAAAEVCNANVDDDCDGLADDDDINVAGQGSFYTDNDNDLFGSGAAIHACIQPVGTAAENNDCNNNNPAINPGAFDMCNGIDDNCNFTTDENPLAVPTITPQGTISACNGVDVLLTTDSQPSLSYQWFKGSTPQPGATNNTFITNKAGKFNVKISTIPSCEASSAITVIQRFSKPEAEITALGNLNICETGSVDLKANGGTGLLYQWKKGNSLLIGATNLIYTTTSIGSYRVIVSNEAGCSNTSPNVKVTASCKDAQLISGGSDGELVVYPNPAGNHLVVNMKFKEGVNAEAIIAVVDLLGRSVQLSKAQVSDGFLQCDLYLEGTIADGSYFVKVWVNNQLFVKNILLQQ